MVSASHLYCTVIILFFSFECFAQSVWTQVANYGGGPCSFTSAGVINGKAYVPCDNELWEYDPLGDTWVQKSNFPGMARVGPVSFVINSMLYFGTGNILFGALLNDWWRYDPSSDSWLQLNNFPGTARYAAVGFAISSKGYIATGFDNASIYKYDLWEYNPASDSWQQKADLPDVGKYLAAAFAVSGKGYLLTGYESSAGDVKDVWEYNPVSNSWVQKSNFAGVARRQAAGFASSSKGYVITGGTSSSSLTDAWEYNPVADSWMALPNLPAGGRRSAVGFVLNEEPYVGLGFVPAGTTYQDVWKLEPAIMLPVELASFTATVTTEGNLLEWSTASELDNDFFIIERSDDGVSFTDIKVVKGNGSSYSEEYYSFLDKTFLPGVNYYRLRQTDLNGSYTFSNIVVAEQPSAFSTDIYYAPGDHFVMAEINSTHEENLSISVCDIRGIVMQKENISVAPGSNRIKIELPPYLKGIGFIVIEAPMQRRYVGEIAVM